MSALLWTSPLRLLCSARSHHFHARSPWRTPLRAPLPVFKRRFEEFARENEILFESVAGYNILEDGLKTVEVSQERNLGFRGHVMLVKAGFYRLKSTKVYGSFDAGVGRIQKADIKTKATALDEAPLDGLLAFYADHFVVPLPEGHRFPMTKYRATRLLLEGDEQLRDILVTLPASVASIDDVCLVHDEGYVQRFISGGLTEKEQRAVGFPWSVEHRQRSLASTGGTVAAMHTVMQGKRRVAANIAGGTHHAFVGHGEGFCVFNDIAVASAICLRDYPTKCNLQTPIFVVDLDVHQGNGTSKLFENDDRVITFDMHGAGNYPWKSKTKSNYDIGLPDDTEDDDYLATLGEWLPHLIELHDPGLVFFQAGVDALKEDSFGRLAMTRQGLLKRNNMVYSSCIERNLPLVITMGGGYSRPSDASIEAHADVYRSAALRYSVAKGRAQVPFRIFQPTRIQSLLPYLNRRESLAPLDQSPSQFFLKD